MERSLQYIETKWVQSLSQSHRYKLKAALSIERAAMSIRQANYNKALKYLISATAYHAETMKYNLVWKYTGRAIGNRR